MTISSRRGASMLATLGVIALVVLIAAGAYLAFFRKTSNQGPMRVELPGGELAQPNSR